MYLVCWETEIDDSKQITAHDDIIIGHWTLLIYECKRIQGWNLPLRQQSINHTETDSDFIVLFNLITAEAINIKKTHLAWEKRLVFSRNDLQMNQHVSDYVIFNFSSSVPLTVLLRLYEYTLVSDGMATSENRNRACVHPNNIHKHEMPCLKMTLTHVRETELVFLSSPETGRE